MYANDTAKRHRSFAEKRHLTGIAALGIRAVREHHIVYVPIGNRRIVIVALIRQTRDVPAILKENSFIIRRQLDEIADRLKQGKIQIPPE